MAIFFFNKKPLFRHYQKENQQKPFTNYVYGILKNRNIIGLNYGTNYYAGLKQDRVSNFWSGHKQGREYRRFWS